MEAQQTLSGFADHEKSTYCNAASIMFFMISDGPFFICADYPYFEPPDNVSLELYQQFDSIGELMELVGIWDAEKLIEELVPEDLLPFYRSEKIGITCTLEGEQPQELSFRKYQNKLWARDTLEIIHEVTTDLEKPEDFVTYTLQYFNAKCN